MIAAAMGGTLLQYFDPSFTLVWVVIGAGILVLFVLVSRLLASFAGDWLRRRNARIEVVVVGRRVTTVFVIAAGLFIAFGFALENSNIPLLGILLATVVAAFGIQDLLRDYVLGYYVLFERHFRVGDRISFDAVSGTITEVRLRVTLIKNDAGDTVVVPNSQLFSRPVTVFARPEEMEARSKRPE